MYLFKCLLRIIVVFFLCKFCEVKRCIELNLENKIRKVLFINKFISMLIVFNFLCFVCFSFRIEIRGE